MGAKASPSQRTFDAFFSHSSKDSAFATRLIGSLETGNLTAWLDHSSLRFGALLRGELQSAISDSRVLVLLWSEPGSRSRWVISEMLTAFHLRRFIIPVALDPTPLPQFLATSAYLDRKRDKTHIGDLLCRSIRAAPDAPNQVAPLIASETQAVQALVGTVAAGQYRVLDAIVEDRQRAAQANSAVESALNRLKKLAPLHSSVLNLSGYQAKNTYMIKYWDAIQAGRAPKDPLLDESEHYFFDTLCVDPYDASAINGLGTVLFYERELDAAEFFQRRAIELAKHLGVNYEAAQQDLELTLWFKRQQAANH